MSRIVVVGAGLSGLAAGWRLHQAGHEVVVAEQSQDVGGSARSVRHGKYLIDTGPDLINTAYARFLALARELGLGDDIVHSSSRVDVIRDGRPIGFDSARPLSLMRTSLLSRRGKARLALGHLRTRRQVNRIDPFALTRYTDENAQAAQPFSHAAFGPEVSDHLIDPIVRAFAGTGLQHTSALAVLGALAVGREDMLSIKGGMGAVPTAIAERLDIRCGTRVTAIDERAQGVCVTADGGDIDADACLLAVMYDDARQMWPDVAAVMPGFGESLRPVPLISISLGFDAEAETEAYSVLIPTAEEPDALLAFMQRHKAPDRAPDGTTLVTLFTEATSARRFARQTDEEIVTWADERVTRWYPELAGRRDLGLVTRWPCTGYLPTPGFWERSAQLRKALPQARVQVTSTLFGSGSIERAVLGGERAAARLLESLPR